MKKNNLTLGIICILASGISFSLMSFFVKLSGDLPIVQKSFFRNLIAGAIAIIPVLKNFKTIIYPDNIKNWGVLFLRSLLGTLGLLCNFYAVSNIHLADASVIQRISPFVILILSFLIFNEKMNNIEIISIILAFVGILLVIKPNFHNFISYGSLFALIGAFCAGGAYTALRYLGLIGISSEFIVFFFSMFSSISLLPFLIFQYEPMSTSQFLILILVGITGAGGQFGITYAYKFAAAKSLSVFDYSQIIFSGMLGYLFFLEIPDIYSILGYCLIFLMGLVLVYKK